MTHHDKDRSARAATFYKSLFAAVCVGGLVAGEVGDRAKDRALGTTPEEMQALCEKKFKGVPGAWPTCVEDSKGSFERAAMAHGALKTGSGLGLAIMVWLALYEFKRRKFEADSPDGPQ